MSEQAQTTNTTPSTRSRKPHRRPRKPLSCEPCRSAKLRCDRQQPCNTCQRRECATACTFRGVRETVQATPLAHVPNTPERFRQTRSPVSSTAASATDQDPSVLPFHPVSGSRPATHSEGDSFPSLDSVLERPVFGRDEDISGHGNALLPPFSFGSRMSKSELLSMLPPTTVQEYLVSRYFTYQAPLFHVLHGPTFQKQYISFTRDPAQVSLSWLALIFVICSSAIHTLDAGDPVLSGWLATSDLQTNDQLLASRHLRSAALTCLAQDRFMVHYNLNTLEALLTMIYEICHSEGVDRGWVFLGTALNIGIALRCNVDSRNLNCIEKERRRRCWAGILMLHTYQGILFRDIDMSFLRKVDAFMPADVNDSDIHEDKIVEPSARPTTMSLMWFKVGLFQLSSEICSRLSDISPSDEHLFMSHYDSLIASERKEWKRIFLPDGTPSILDTTSYAYWCILETYAHQLYLLIHRPYYHPHTPQYIPSSRRRYLESSMALLDLHRQICELPTLRPYRWLANGMTSFNAVQGAVALAGCINNRPEQADTTELHWEALDAAVQRLKALQQSSPVCAKAYPALRDLLIQLSNSADGNGNGSSQELITNTPDWLNLDCIDWVYWDNVVSQTDDYSY
ncbi:hypothetical protein NM208_g1007 [Fusarium decemcellulare]|uniref:Uncharacterized protein n=1 Tax=Fusarium decemcellulare TaxID=57161 RepID=A0ACC1SXJ9_9HYPO|nr:hypothetical protein NM208_g1007 [Fusarium decemcellulare]